MLSLLWRASSDVSSTVNLILPHKQECALPNRFTVRNLRTRYFPDPEKEIPQKPILQRDNKFHILHLFPDALARAAAFRPNLGWPQTLEFA